MLRPIRRPELERSAGARPIGTCRQPAVTTDKGLLTTGEVITSDAG